MRNLLIPMLVVMALAGTTVPVDAQLAGQTVVIAVAGPLSGGGALFGVEQKQAVELAVAEQNAAGGSLGAQIELATADDRADAGEGQADAARFCDDPRVLGGAGDASTQVSV